MRQMTEEGRGVCVRQERDPSPIRGRSTETLRGADGIERWDGARCFGTKAFES